MQVEYSGWTQEHGSFHCDIFIDESRIDYELHYKSGVVARQKTPFEVVTADWNHDGDIYPQFGAWFESVLGSQITSGGSFWTPEDMVRAVADANDPNTRQYGDHVIASPGIEIPAPEKRASLEDKILRSERRSEAQEIERNRRMNALGIRPPDEPWAR